MKFRKKPIVIEAEEYRPYEPTLPDGVCLCHVQQHRLAHIHTLEGLMLVNSGDWIITGVKGEKYPCKPDIFEATYEPVS
jgi:hypothetical protein